MDVLCTGEPSLTFDKNIVLQKPLFVTVIFTVAGKLTTLNQVNGDEMVFEFAFSWGSFSRPCGWCSCPLCRLFLQLLWACDSPDLFSSIEHPKFARLRSLYTKKPEMKTSFFFKKEVQDIAPLIV